MGGEHLIHWVRAGIREMPRYVGDVAVLEYGRRPRLLFASATAFFLIAASLAQSRVPPPQRVDAFVLFLSLATICATATTTLSYARVTFALAGVTVRSLGRRSRVIAWSDVERVRLGGDGRTCRIETWTHGRISLSYWLDGRPALIAEFKRRGVRFD